MSLVGLGVLLGVTASIRYVTAYLLFLVPIAIVLGDKDRVAEGKPTLRRQVRFPYGRVAILAPHIYFHLYPCNAGHSDVPRSVRIFGRDTHIRPHWMDRKHFVFWTRGAAQHLPWHYVYGYMLVQLPLYYHLFAATLLFVVVVRPRRTLRTSRFRRANPQGATTFILLLGLLLSPWSSSHWCGRFCMTVSGTYSLLSPCCAWYFIWDS